MEEMEIGGKQRFLVKEEYQCIARWKRKKKMRRQKKTPKNKDGPRHRHREKQNFDRTRPLADKRVSATHNAAWVDLAGSTESLARVVLTLCLWLHKLASAA